VRHVDRCAAERGGYLRNTKEIGFWTVNMNQQETCHAGIGGIPFRWTAAPLPFQVWQWMVASLCRIQLSRGVINDTLADHRGAKISDPSVATTGLAPASQGGRSSRQVSRPGPSPQSYDVSTVLRPSCSARPPGTAGGGQPTNLPRWYRTIGLAPKNTLKIKTRLPRADNFGRGLQANRQYAASRFQGF